MNSVMSLPVRRVANEFVCLSVYPDLRRPPEARQLFGLLTSDCEAVAPLPADEVKTVIADLHERVLVNR